MIRELRMMGLGLFACASLTMAPRTEAVAAPGPQILNAFDTVGTVTTNIIPGGPRTVQTGQGTALPTSIGVLRIYPFPGSAVPGKTLQIDEGFLVITTDGTASGEVKGSARFLNDVPGPGAVGLIFGAGSNIDATFRALFPELFLPGADVVFAQEIPVPVSPGPVGTPVNPSLLGVLYTPGAGEPGSPIGDFAGTNFGYIFATSGTIIPAPAALAIFGMGLAGLGLARRRKAGQSAIAA